MTNIRRFSIEPEVFNNLRSELLSQMGFELQQDSLYLSRQYYDSFDWRLYHASFALFMDSDSQCKTLHLDALKRPQRYAEIIVDKMPPYAAGFAPSVQQQILEIVEHRRLLPSLASTIHSREFHLFDKDNIFIATIQGVKETFQSLSYYYIEVQEVAQQNEEFDYICKWLDENVTLHGPLAHPLQLAVLDLKIKPEQIRSRITCNNAKQPAIECIKNLFNQLHEKISTNERGTVRNLDSEFLSDYRCAIKSTIELIEQSKHFWPKDLINRFDNGFLWLRKLTANVHTYEIFSRRLPELCRMIPPNLQSIESDLSEFLADNAIKAREKMIKGMLSHRYRDLMDNWRYFNSQDEQSIDMKAASFALQRIRSNYKKEAKLADQLSPVSSTADMEKIRTKHNTLCTLIEFFGGFFNTVESEKLYAQLRSVQSVFSRFHACTRQIETLRRAEKTLDNLEKKTATRLLAIHIGVKQRQYRDQITNELAQLISEMGDLLRSIAEKTQTFSADHSRLVI